VALHRTHPAPDAPVRALVRSAFAVRRKTLVNALGQAGADRDAVRAALVAMGLQESVRPEQVTPADYTRLAHDLDWPAAR
jgi:16S rRNA A1518/A1519 N6-dimethyltransferase RsmA/KsgA/DIM1 with predicted DNA glycosylase/AP lyase activity